MDEKFNKNSKVEQFTIMLFSCEEEKGLIVKDPIFKFSPEIETQYVEVFKNGKVQGESHTNLDTEDGRGQKGKFFNFILCTHKDMLNPMAS